LLSFDPQTGQPVIEGGLEVETAEAPDVDPLFPNAQTLQQKRRNIIAQELASGTTTRTGANAAAESAPITDPEGPLLSDSSSLGVVVDESISANRFNAL
jgi:hypothetical protein